MLVDGDGFRSRVSKLLNQVEQELPRDSPVGIGDSDHHSRPAHGDGSRQDAEIRQRLLRVLQEELVPLRRSPVPDQPDLEVRDLLGEAIGLRVEVGEDAREVLGALGGQPVRRLFAAPGLHADQKSNRRRHQDEGDAGLEAARRTHGGAPTLPRSRGRLSPVHSHPSRASPAGRPPTHSGHGPRKMYRRMAARLLNMRMPNTMMTPIVRSGVPNRSPTHTTNAASAEFARNATMNSPSW